MQLCDSVTLRFYESECPVNPKRTGPQRYVIFRETDDDEGESYVVKINGDGRLMETRDVRRALGFDSPRSAYNWCVGVTQLYQADWKVGKRECAALDYGKAHLFSRRVRMEAKDAAKSAT